MTRMTRMNGNHQRLSAVGRLFALFASFAVQNAVRRRLGRFFLSCHSRFNTPSAVSGSEQPDHVAVFIHVNIDRCRPRRQSRHCPHLTTEGVEEARAE